MAEIQSAAENQQHLNGAVVSTSETAVGSKRQRRPSVRLGDIGGDQPYDSHSHSHHHARAIRTKHHNNPPSQLPNNIINKPSKTKPLTNLTSETLDDDAVEAINNNNNSNNHNNINNNSNLDTVIGSWRVKDSKKRGSAKRVRSNWVVSSSTANNAGDDDIENDDYDREFDVENSESPLSKEQSPVHSLENLADGSNERERELGYHHHNINRRSMSNNNGGGGGGGGGGGEDGVRIWLRSLGLGRYAPVFEIHEVDDEVLPMLTLEDLKDMGINAVGSRRKMFCAIQKLSKGFS